MRLEEVRIGLTVEDCLRLVEAVRRDRARMRAFARPSAFRAFERLADEIEAVVAPYVSGAGHRREEYSPESRSVASAPGHEHAESLVQPKQSSSLGARQAAELLGVSARQVRRLAQAQQIRATRLGTAWVFDRGDVMAAKEVGSG